MRYPKAGEEGSVYVEVIRYEVLPLPAFRAREEVVYMRYSPEGKTATQMLDENLDALTRALTSLGQVSLTMAETFKAFGATLAASEFKTDLAEALHHADCICGRCV